MKQTVLVVIGVVAAVTLVVVGFTLDEANKERLRLSADLQYRTRLLADSLKESVEPSFISNSTSTLEKLVNRFADRERVVGLAVFGPKGDLVVGSLGFPARAMEEFKIVGEALDRDEPAGDFASLATSSLYALALPLHQNERLVGVFVAVQDASYIDASVAEIWRTNLVRLFVQITLFAGAIILLLWLVIFRPLRRMTETVKTARSGRGISLPQTARGDFFKPLAAEISKMTTSLIHARTAASEEARMRLEKLDTPWTAERLKEFIKAYLKDRPVVIVSNREPYTHYYVKNEIRSTMPASGMVTALEPLMEACGGIWVAHGSGDADKETADEGGTLMVPTDDPKYTLKRVWLTEKEVAGYYVGFSNEALWPLCHMAHTRPTFRKEDWQAYRKVNGTFAKHVLEEIKDLPQPLILVQDFHLSLLPAMLKKSRPDAQVGIFWHIPWPAAEVFSICPWRKEILEGMLGADIVGFHTQQYCNNFLDTVGKEVESLIDFDQWSVSREGHRSSIKPFPISIAFPTGIPEETSPEKIAQAYKNLGVTTKYRGLGVDRMDYTKGIMERLRAIEFLLTNHAEYRGEFTFLQIAPPSREGVLKYREYNAAVTAEAERINKKFAAKNWQPIMLVKEHLSHAELLPLYRGANVCLVTSVHDGMNLVAKEFVAARNDEGGVLILSQFTGSARDLKGALIVNPYSAEEVSEAVAKALSMTPSEQHRRMKAMREQVKNYNVYRWSAELIKAVASIG